MSPVSSQPGLLTRLARKHCSKNAATKTPATQASAHLNFVAKRKPEPIRRNLLQLSPAEAKCPRRDLVLGAQRGLKHPRIVRTQRDRYTSIVRLHHGMHRKYVNTAPPH